MSFAHPWMLFLLTVPVLIMGWVWRRKSRRVAVPFDHGRQSSGAVWAAVIDVAECLPALMLAAAILILAGPRRWGEPLDRRVLTNIEFCVDISGSMTAKFGEGSRYDASLAAINDFLDYRKGDAFGLTFFGNSVLHWVPLTSDASAIRCAPPFMRPEQAPPGFGGTEIGKALMACRQVLATREEGDRMIILISDGDSFDLWGGRDMEIAKRLKEDNIVVYDVHIGGDRVPDPIVNITALTGGEFFEPGDTAALADVFRRIDAMRPTRMEKTAPEALDNFVPFSLAALSLLGVGVACLFGWRYTPW
jgi:Ca-activated chloride channel family protein